MACTLLRVFLVLATVQYLHCSLFHTLSLLLKPSSLSLPGQRDLEALENKVKVLSRESSRLCTTYPESSVRVWGKEEVVDAWTALVARSLAREAKLVEAEQVQRYLTNFRDLR